MGELQQVDRKKIFEISQWKERDDIDRNEGAGAKLKNNQRNIWNCPFN